MGRSTSNTPGISSNFVSTMRARYLLHLKRSKPRSLYAVSRTPLELHHSTLSRPQILSSLLNTPPPSPVLRCSSDSVRCSFVLSGDAEFLIPATRSLYRYLW